MLRIDFIGICKQHNVETRWINLSISFEAKVLFSVSMLCDLLFLAWPDHWQQMFYVRKACHALGFSLPVKEKIDGECRRG
jgi:hypothetical protein